MGYASHNSHKDTIKYISRIQGIIRNIHTLIGQNILSLFLLWFSVKRNQVFGVKIVVVNA
jgi:hypothetical protein